VATLAGQGGASLEKLKGVPIPVRIKGSFQKPGFSVDLAQAVTEQQKQRVEKKVEKVKEKAREELKDKLKGLFGK
jgi:AsmA protein